MGGYWAIGSENTAIAPANVMTIDSTEAKIGRSMKKREITAMIASRLGEGQWGEGVAGRSYFVAPPGTWAVGARAWESLPSPLSSAAAPVAGR